MNAQLRRLAECRYCERYGRACGRDHSEESRDDWGRDWKGALPVEAWKGLRVDVFRRAGRDGYDGSNGGVSGACEQLSVVGYKLADGRLRQLPREARVFEADEAAPAVVLVESRVPGLYGPHLEPLEAPAGVAGPMASGNYAALIDSRWGQLGELFAQGGRLEAVPVHDRFESWAQYRALSID